MKRKFLLIVVVLLLLAFIIFLMFKYRKSNPNANLSSPQSVFSKEKLLGFDFCKNKQQFYLLTRSNTLIASILQNMNSSGSGEQLPNNIISLSASSDCSSIILSQLGENEELPSVIYLFDTASKKLSTPKTSLFGATWSPDGSKIAYIYLDNQTNKASLDVAEKNLSNWQAVYPLDNVSYQLVWLGNDKILAFYKPLDRIEQPKNYLIDVGKKQAVSQSLPVINGAFSNPSNKKIIIASNDKKNYLFDAEKNSLLKLDFNKEIGNCLWLDDKNIIINSPQADTRWSDIYKINTETQKSSLLFESDTKTNYTIQNMATDGKTLYFTSGDYLYQLSL